MEQTSLFANADSNADHPVIRFSPRFDDWLQAAWPLLAKGIQPARCQWVADPDAKRLRTGRSKPVALPDAFVTLARSASCHSSADRWDLLYAVAWRLLDQQAQLLSIGSDPMIVRLNKYASAVRRDAHKMKAFVRFREVDAMDGSNLAYVAWFEPEHPIVEYTAPFFMRRFHNMRWSILTPSACVHWDGPDSGGLQFSAGVSRACASDSDALEDAWRTYYRNIFNPARLKIKAMQSEMPQKYWKNLPEAAEISKLTLQAHQRTATMRNTHKAADVLQCGPKPMTPEQDRHRTIAQHSEQSLQSLALQAQNCQRCALCEAATQTVFGRGPNDARLMLVGEQPGDHEDLSGLPFTGPAGGVLSQAMVAADVDESGVYITNAVKHFKFRPTGKKRLHMRPLHDEVEACLPWLQAEIDQVKPAVVVALGVTAAYALLGQQIDLRQQRGKAIQQSTYQLVLSYHPAYILRSCGKQWWQGRAFHELTQDLASAAANARGSV